MKRAEPAYLGTCGQSRHGGHCPVLGPCWVQAFGRRSSFQRMGSSEKTSSCLTGRMSILFSQLAGENRKEPWYSCEQLRVVNAQHMYCLSWCFLKMNGTQVEVVWCRQRQQSSSQALYFPKLQVCSWPHHIGSQPFVLLLFLYFIHLPRGLAKYCSYKCCTSVRDVSEMVTLCMNAYQYLKEPKWKRKNFERGETLQG